MGERFFAHVQTGPEAHPASCTMGTGSFPGVKRPRHEAYIITYVYVGIYREIAEERPVFLEVKLSTIVRKKVI
jgi:hypothetical protein